MINVDRCCRPLVDYVLRDHLEKIISRIDLCARESLVISALRRSDHCIINTSNVGIISNIFGRDGARCLFFRIRNIRAIESLFFQPYLYYEIYVFLF